jgi:hypothetical protein
LKRLRTHRIITASVIFILILFVLIVKPFSPINLQLEVQLRGVDDTYQSRLVVYPHNKNKSNSIINSDVQAMSGADGENYGFVWFYLDSDAQRARAVRFQVRLDRQYQYDEAGNRVPVVEDILNEYDLETGELLESSAFPVHIEKPTIEKIKIKAGVNPSKSIDIMEFSGDDLHLKEVISKEYKANNSADGNLYFQLDQAMIQDVYERASELSLTKMYLIAILIAAYLLVLLRFTLLKRQKISHFVVTLLAITISVVFVAHILIDYKDMRIEEVVYNRDSTPEWKSIGPANVQDFIDYPIKVTQNRLNGLALNLNLFYLEGMASDNVNLIFAELIDANGHSIVKDAVTYKEHYNANETWTIACPEGKSFGNAGDYTLRISSSSDLGLSLNKLVYTYNVFNYISAAYVLILIFLILLLIALNYKLFHIPLVVMKVGIYTAGVIYAIWQSWFFERYMMRESVEFGPGSTGGFNQTLLMAAIAVAFALYIGWTRLKDSLPIHFLYVTLITGVQIWLYSIISDFRLSLAVISGELVLLALLRMSDADFCIDRKRFLNNGMLSGIILAIGISLGVIVGSPYSQCLIAISVGWYILIMKSILDKLREDYNVFQNELLAQSYTRVQRHQRKKNRFIKYIFSDSGRRLYHQHLPQMNIIVQLPFYLALIILNSIILLTEGKTQLPMIRESLRMHNRMHMGPWKPFQYIENMTYTSDSPFFRVLTEYWSSFTGLKSSVIAHFTQVQFRDGVWYDFSKLWLVLCVFLIILGLFYSKDKLNRNRPFVLYVAVGVILSIGNILISTVIGSPSGDSSINATILLPLIIGIFLWSCKVLISVDDQERPLLMIGTVAINNHAIVSWFAYVISTLVMYGGMLYTLLHLSSWG